MLACAASAREKTISATYVAANSAAVQLVAYSHDHEAQIVAGAKSEAEGKAQLADFRAKVDKAAKALDGVYRAIATAAVLNDDQTLSAMVQAALLLSTELHELGVLKP